MNSRFVVLGALALSFASVASSPVGAQTPAPVAAASAPAAEPTFAPATVPEPVPAATPTPVSVPSLSPAATVDPAVKAAMDILSGFVNRQFQNARNVSDGRVTYFWRFDLQVQQGKNSYRKIRLHQGTVINPTGGSLMVGMHVHVEGDAQNDGSLAANEITIER